MENAHVLLNMGPPPSVVDMQLGRHVCVGAHVHTCVGVLFEMLGAAGHCLRPACSYYVLLL